MPRIAVLGLLSVTLLGAAHLAQAQTDSSATSTEPNTTEESVTSTSATPFDPLNPQDIEAKVRAAFPDVPVMVAIAKCESGFRQYDEDGHPLYGGSGGMVGVFQEAASIHSGVALDMGYDINTLDGNIAYARYLYETEGTVPWLASASCWNPAPLTATLRMGSTGSQVLALQRMLNKLGYIVAKDGPGSPGEETSTFGPATRDAVRRLQCDMDIVCSGNEKTSGYGLVGSHTRLALAHLDAKLTQRSPSKALSVQ